MVLSICFPLTMHELSVALANWGVMQRWSFTCLKQTHHQLLCFDLPEAFGGVFSTISNLQVCWLHEHKEEHWWCYSFNPSGMYFTIQHSIASQEQFRTTTLELGVNYIILLLLAFVDFLCKGSMVNDRWCCIRQTRSHATNSVCAVWFTRLAVFEVSPYLPMDWDIILTWKAPIWFFKDCWSPEWWAKRPRKRPRDAATCFEFWSVNTIQQQQQQQESGSTSIGVHLLCLVEK
jgi:hypothetical protein